MDPQVALFIEGRKFMWDGCPYDTREEALRAADLYQKDGFEVQVRDEEGKTLVYTRRLVGQVAVAVQQ
jgi:hypothetical protein